MALRADFPGNIRTMAKPPSKRGEARRGMGAGWGGPAKGGGGSTPRPAFETGNTSAAGRSDPNPDRRIEAEVLRAHMYRLATQGERQETQVAAAREWFNRTEGLPVARTITVATDDISQLDDAALAKRQAELEARLRSSA